MSRSSSFDKHVDKVVAVFRKHKGRYGVPRVTEELRETGYQISRYAVERVFEALNLCGRAGRARKARQLKKQTCVRQEQFPDLVQKRFLTDAPNEVHASDVTYLRLRGGKNAYLSVVMDMYDRAVLGWSLSTRHDEELTTAALAKSFERKDVNSVDVVHTDRGGEFRGHQYSKMVSRNGAARSFSRSGHCEDNAVVESFHKTLKLECDHLFDCRSLEQLHAVCHDYIHYYNHDRRHTHRKTTPMKAREQALTQTAA